MGFFNTREKKSLLICVKCHSGKRYFGEVVELTDENINYLEVTQDMMNSVQPDKFGRKFLCKSCESEIRKRKYEEEKQFLSKHYALRLVCGNCERIQDVFFKKGTGFLEKKKFVCENCGCTQKITKNSIYKAPPKPPTFSCEGSAWFYGPEYVTCRVCKRQFHKGKEPMSNLDWEEVDETGICTRFLCSLKALFE